MSGSEDVLLTRICSVTAEDQTEATNLQENQSGDRVYLVVFTHGSQSGRADPEREL